MTRWVMMAALAMVLGSGGGAGITGGDGVAPAWADPFPPDRAFAPSTPYPYPPHELPVPAYELPIEFGGPEAPEAAEPQSPAKAEKAEKSEKQKQIDKIQRRTGHKVKSWQVLER